MLMHLTLSCPKILIAYGEKLTLEKCPFFVNMHVYTNPTDENDKTAIGSCVGEGVCYGI